MALSQDIKLQFAKAMTPQKEPSETTIDGTFKIINGKEYVQLDGSDILTPVKSTVVAETGDRVKVLLKEHSAVVNGNITCPSARSKDLDNMKDEVDEFGNTVKMLDNSIQMQESSIIQLQTNINQHEVTINQHETTIQQQGDNIVSLQNDILLQNNQISAINNDINLQGNKIDSMNNTIESQGNDIVEMNNTIVTINNKVQSYDNEIEQMGNKIIEFNNTIDSQNNAITEMNNKVQSYDNTILSLNNDIISMNNNITTMNSDITILNSGFSIVDGQLTGLSEIIINSIKTNLLHAHYAEIDFSNIDIAAIEHLFTESGIIKDLVVNDGAITGQLVGVTITGDLIEGNTIKADKLVVLGEDGLYYKLNVNAETVASEQTEHNSLNGSIITAKSITADRINVTDLVAFDATIGGFDISQNSIHTHTKADIDSDANGIYMDDIGQLYVGDEENHIKYYQTENEGEYVLDITASIFRFTGSTKSINQVLDEQELTNDQLRDQIDEADSRLTDSINNTDAKLDNSVSEINENMTNIHNELTVMIDANTRKIDINAQQMSLTFKTTGGNNLIRNSVGYNKTNFWPIHSGDINTNQEDGMSLSGSEFIFTGASTLAQTFNTIIGQSYSVSFKLKHKVVGTAGNIKVELVGESEENRVVCNTSEEFTEWTHISISDILGHPYQATIEHPKLQITITDSAGGDIFEITDLFVACGEVEIWSSHEEEVYGKQHLLDEDGLQLFNLSSNDYSKTTSTNMTMQHNGIVTAELSKDRVYSNSGEFTNKYSIGKLMTVVLDENNIIEYI